MAGDGTVHGEPAFAGLRPSDDEFVVQVLGGAEVHFVGRLAARATMTAHASSSFAFAHPSPASTR